MFTYCSNSSYVCIPYINEFLIYKSLWSCLLGWQCHGVYSFECSFTTCSELIPNY